MQTTTLPLYSSDEVLKIRLEAPFARLLDEYEAAGHYRASMVVKGGGDSLELAIHVQARGKARLRTGICNFPGLMLYFDDSPVDGTPFDGHDILPLTTHCRTDRRWFEQYMLLEYLTYRTYTELTDLSLRVRLARIEYVDSDREMHVTTKYGFFLEHWDNMAARNGWVRVQAPVIPPQEYDLAQRNLFEVFQYMIGNTDWSMALAAPDDSYCCHNAVPVGDPAGPVFPVPFDFDQAGIVNPPYAIPSPTLSITRVRQRLYRGFCDTNDRLDGTLDRFRQERPAIEALFQLEALSDRARKQAEEYLEGFFNVIDDANAAQRDLAGRCRTK